MGKKVRRVRVRGVENFPAITLKIRVSFFIQSQAFDFKCQQTVTNER